MAEDLTQRRQGAKLTPNEASKIAVDSALTVHRAYGPGLLESAYEAMLAAELTARKIAFRRQVIVPLRYRNQNLGEGFRADLIVEDCLLIELKSIEAVGPIHKKQVLTYLRLTGLKLGLLINFGAQTIRDGTSRIVNGL